MKFKSITDLIQVFANEYTLPGSTVLVIGSGLEPGIKDIFTFIDSEVIFVSPTCNSDIVVTDYHDLPFEEHSFDLIINFTESDVFRLLKPNGYVLLKGEIINGLEYHSIKNEIFTVL